MLSTKKKHLDVDTVFGALFLLLFAVGVHAFQYRSVLGEADLYRVLNGMLDGAVTGSGLDSPLHYGRDFGFGYILALYAFVPVEVLRDPDRLIPVINNLGFYSIILGLFFFWLSTYLVHGSRTATVAMALFAFSPMILELGTSGHPILIAFAFFSAAAACLFLPVSGLQAALAAAAGTILLVCGLCVRAEIFLALPYLALTRIYLTSRKTLLKSVIVTALSPTAAFIIFFALKHYMASYPSNIDHDKIERMGFFKEFYHWSNVVPGIAYMSLGCGIATVLVGAGVMVFVVTRSVRPRASDDVKGTLEQLTGPIALVLVPFVFWIANPQPSRHFLLVLAGISILIGWAIGHLLRFRFVPALVTALGIIAGNQLLSEAVRPALLRMNAARSPYRSAPESNNTFTHAPLGFIWRHHAVIESRLLRWKTFGDVVATSCDANTVIFSDESEQIFSRLYAGGASVQLDESPIPGFITFEGIVGARRFVLISKITGWPQDAVAAVLANHNFDDYRLYADPFLPSIYDKTAIPVGRLARFGC